jgi:hypothetical protein
VAISLDIPTSNLNLFVGFQLKVDQNGENFNREIDIHNGSSLYVMLKVHAFNWKSPSG